MRVCHISFKIKFYQRFPENRSPQENVHQVFKPMIIKQSLHEYKVSSSGQSTDPARIDNNVAESSFLRHSRHQHHFSGQRDDETRSIGNIHILT